MNSRIVVAFSNAETDPHAHGAHRRLWSRAFGQQVEYRETPGDDGYAKLFRELWLDGRNFILIEQKVFPTEPMLNALDACPEPWCVHSIAPADHIPDVGACFVLSKFRPIGAVPFEGLPHYEDMPSAVYAELQSRGFHPHQHDPPVIRLQPLPLQTRQIPGPRYQT